MIPTLPNSRYTTIPLVAKHYGMEISHATTMFERASHKKKLKELGSLTSNRGKILKDFSRSAEDEEFIIENCLLKSWSNRIYPEETFEVIEELVQWRREIDEQRAESKLTINGYFLYIVKCKRNDVYKIGITSRFKNRLRDINTYAPYGIELYAKFEYANRREMKMMELWCHSNFKSKNTNLEWFELDECDLGVITDSLKRSRLSREHYNELERYVMENCAVDKYGQAYTISEMDKNETIVA